MQSNAHGGRSARLRCATIGALAAILFAGLPASATVQAHAAVVGGRPGTVPGLVLIEWYGYDCTGTVIASNAILTAAHCATGPAAAYHVTASLPWQAAGHTLPPVARVIPDPAYNPAANYTNDAAVLVLSHPTTIAPVALDPTEPPAGTPATFAGYGETAVDSGGPNGPNIAGTVVQSNDYCSAWWGADWAPTDLCALDAPADTTSIGDGDSGGPLIVAGRQAGINDRVDQTYAGTSPSIFTRVDLALPWIRAEITANPPTWRVPALHGLTLPQARRALARARLALGPVRHLKARNRRGTVRLQTPGGGCRRPAETRITVWL